MRLKKDVSIVPVVMFHSVGNRIQRWVWSDLSESLAVFERTLAALVDRGFSSVSLQDLYLHMSGAIRLPANSIVLSFDDGYLDNWVNVVPLLQKYGMSGVVYVTPEFVENSNVLRPTLKDALEGRANDADSGSVGFMNWEELKEVDRCGVLDVQCHALSHTWYFSGPRIVDVHRPRQVYQYPWLSWNARPDRKPYYLTEYQQDFVPWGQPVFEHEKSLIVHRFVPEQSQVDVISEFVEIHGGVEFFEQSTWRAELTSRFPVLNDGEAFPGEYESEGDYRARVYHELSESRQILERELQKTVEFLSWPGGGVDETALELAKQAGFKSWTLSSWQKPEFRNRPGADASEIKRVSGHSKVYWRGRLLNDGDPSWIVLRILTHQGSLMSKIVGICKKLIWIATSRLRNQSDDREFRDAT